MGLLLLNAAALSVLALLLWPGGGEQHEARAYPGLTVAIDMDPSTTTDADGDGIYETVDINTFEDCIDVTAGQQFPVVVSVLDVLDLTAFLADVEYDGSVVKIVGAYTGTTPSNTPTMFLSAQPNSDVQNESQNTPAPSTGVLLTPDTDGKYQAAAFDASHAGTGDSGSGILVRLTLEATAAGVSPFNIDAADLDGDGYQDRGAVLQDVNAVVLGDSNGDGFFDGPFINASSTIAVDQPDPDSDGLSNGCDPDDDGDGYCDPGESDPTCTGSDNCPDVYNPSQTDIDGDGLGDPCDTWDADGDGYTNAKETSYVSQTLDPSSTPEVCDGIDNDLDTLTDEGPGDPPIPFADSDADTVPDCVDSDVDTDSDGQYNPSDADDDGDGSPDSNEYWMLTDSLVACDNGVDYPDWPPDFNDSKRVDLLDVLNLKPAFNTSVGQANYETRYDLNADSSVDLLDLLPFKADFTQTCP